MADDKTPAPYIYRPYPAKRYGPRGATCYVQNEAEDKALGPGWFDHPTRKATAPKDKE